MVWQNEFKENDNRRMHQNEVGQSRLETGRTGEQDIDFSLFLWIIRTKGIDRTDRLSDFQYGCEIV